MRVRTYCFPGFLRGLPGPSTRNHPHDPTTSKPVVPGGMSSQILACCGFIVSPPRLRYSRASLQPATMVAGRTGVARADGDRMRRRHRPARGVPARSGREAAACARLARTSRCLGSERYRRARHAQQVRFRGQDAEDIRPAEQQNGGRSGSDGTHNGGTGRKATLFRHRGGCNQSETDQHGCGQSRPSRFRIGRSRADTFR